MKVKIIAVGRLRKGPELDLIQDYVTRFNRAGRAHSLGPIEVIEVEDKKGGGKTGEAALLRRALPNGAHIIALDERGTVMTSPEFSKTIAGVRDAGASDLAFVIGGADGIDPAFLSETNSALSFGKMVWPHMLVRVMLAEQLYRAASILGGSPYHRV